MGWVRVGQDRDGCNKPMTSCGCYRPELLDSNRKSSSSSSSSPVAVVMGVSPSPISTPWIPLSSFAPIYVKSFLIFRLTLAICLLSIRALYFFPVYLFVYIAHLLYTLICPSAISVERLANILTSVHSKNNPIF
jgi:hypothetical protein